MKLSTIRINEFRSIIDSNWFEVGDITCLVGKNESGKTALLQALYKLNPIINSDGNFNVTQDYPRFNVESYRYEIESGQRESARVAEVKFSLEAPEVDQIKNEFGKKVLKSQELYLCKGYDDENFSFLLELDEEAAISYVISQLELDSAARKTLSKANDFIELESIIIDEVAPSNSDKTASLLEKVKRINETDLSDYIFNRYISKHIPRFLYFDEFYQMKGLENLEALINRKNSNALEPSDYPLLGFLNLARIDLAEIKSLQNTQDLKNKLEGASNFITGRILRYWSQNKHIELRFDIRPAMPKDPPGLNSGTNIWSEVYDSKHKVSTSIGSRSRGFIWFFSFLAWYIEQQKNNQPLILLLDEPGLFLHGRAQEDLLNYLENELKPNHQVIYTTHSPFMIDPTRFDRVRIVQDIEMDSNEVLPEEERGTKVLTDILEATEDSLFPLQGALGYDISQTLFVGPNSLIVEGVSDLLFIQTINDLLERSGRTSLSKKWIITPVGGSDKVPTFVSLLSSQKGLNIATLIDIQTKDQQSIENLYKKKLLKKQSVLTFGDFLKRPEADIEDFFGDRFYLKLVNEEYSKEMKRPIEETDIAKGSPRIVVRIENYFKTNPLKSVNVFNHFRPARYFAESASSLYSDIPASTFDLFEETFKTLNKLVK